MEIRRKISAAIMMLSCFFAMALNAFVVLTCDCTSCHTHTTHACMCEECALFEGDTFLSQHCECTHTHENSTDAGVTADSERVLKLMKVAVAELPRSLIYAIDTCSHNADSSMNCPQSIPLVNEPCLGVGGLRAPPVFA